MNRQIPNTWIKYLLLQSNDDFTKELLQQLQKHGIKHDKITLYRLKWIGFNLIDDNITKKAIAASWDTEYIANLICVYIKHIF